MTSNALDGAVPATYAGELDGVLLEAYFADLTQFAMLEEVLLKTAATEHAETARVTLDQARMLLVLGRVGGVQIRYEHDGARWIDTLLHRGARIEIVRIRA